MSNWESGISSGIVKLITTPKSIPNFSNIPCFAVIVDENDRVVCFGICFPSIAKSVQKCKGHLTPLGALRILWEIKHPTVIDLALIGVLPEYAMKGISSSFISTVHKMLKNPKIDHIETNLNLETNTAIQNQWKSFKTVQHKRRRSFVKKID